MSEEFPRAQFLSKGYDIDQVDEFLARARAAYEGQDEDDSFTSWHVRTVGFDLHRFGARYDTEAVDAAFVRVEDAFAKRERENSEKLLGGEGWLATVRKQEQSIRAQLAKPDGQRFPHGSGLELTYDVDQVDALCRRIEDSFINGQPIPVQPVRTAVFTSRRGSRGYREGSVDSFLDKVVELLSSVNQ